MPARSTDRDWWPRFGRTVWILQLGTVVNLFGLGVILPFEIIYLHDVRGFSTTTAGLVLATVMAVAAVTAPPFGALLDRIGGKLVLGGGALFSTVGYGLMGFVHHPAEAFACSVVSGIGAGSGTTAGPALLAALTTAETRASAFALGRVTVNLGIALGATTGGLIASTADPSSFRLLYLIDGATFLAYALVVLVLIPPTRASRRTAGADGAAGFRAVGRDRPFLALMAANVAFIVVGYTLFANILPAYAKGKAHVDEREIGFIFLVNTTFIILAALPISHAVQRRRRTTALAVMSGIWAAACLIVLASSAAGSPFAATAVLALAGILCGIGECIHASVIGPTVAQLAPPALVGRYMSLMGLSFTAAFALGPAIGGALLGWSPDGLWVAAACLVALTGAGVLRFGRLPAAVAG